MLALVGLANAGPGYDEIYVPPDMTCATTKTFYSEQGCCSNSPPLAPKTHVLQTTGPKHLEFRNQTNYIASYAQDPIDMGGNATYRSIIAIFDDGISKTAFETSLFDIGGNECMLPEEWESLGESTASGTYQTLLKFKLDEPVDGRKKYDGKLKNPWMGRCSSTSTTAYFDYNSTTNTLEATKLKFKGEAETCRVPSGSEQTEIGIKADILVALQEKIFKNVETPYLAYVQETIEIIEQALAYTNFTSQTLKSVELKTKVDTLFDLAFAKPPFNFNVKCTNETFSIDTPAFDENTQLPKPTYYMLPQEYNIPVCSDDVAVMIENFD